MKKTTTIGTKVGTTGVALLVAVVGLAVTAVPSGAQTSAAGGVGSAGAAGPTSGTVASTVAPDARATTEAPASDPAAAAAAHSRLLDRRDAQAAAVTAVTGPGPVVSPLPSGPTNASAKAGAELLTTTRNTQNSVAKSVASTLAEPAAAVDDREVVYTGNAFGSRSTDSGNTWTQFTYPAGPSEASVACCDTDVVHHSGTDTTFHILLYTNAAQTNGNIRIFVRRGATDVVDCTYTIDPGGASTMLPDYPHIAVSNGFLYLSYQKLNGTGAWVGSDMVRYNVTQMSNCQTAATSTYAYTGSVGQRIIVPAEGATTTMYWGVLDNTTTFRLFKWADSSSTVSSNTYSVATSAFNNPDCRGGTNNYDFIERGTSWSIAGFRMRGAVAGNVVQFVWPSSPVGSVTQAHVRGVVINPTSNTKVQETIIFNNAYCFGYPVLGGNSDGEFSVSLASGGKSGGGGTAAQGFVGVDDASTSGYWFQNVSLTAAGTTNRSDGRFGDYFTVRANERCPRTWVATNYAWQNGSTSSSNVNARFVMFQSNTEPTCSP